MGHHDWELSDVRLQQVGGMQERAHCVGRNLQVRREQ